VMNVLGAGDAFMAGLLKGWLSGASWREAARMANACGALVVARHACSASMPTPDELEYFMGRPGLDRPDQDAHLARLHRVSRKRQRWDDLAVLAFDHRAQFKDLAREAGAAESRIPELKSLLVRATAETEESLGLQGHVGVLLDDTYGEDALFAASGRGWWVGRPVEVPGSRPLQFEGGRSIGSRLIGWPREHVVKCLVRFHPDDPADVRGEQETQLRALYDAVQASGHELLLEVIPPSEIPCDERTIARALDRIYEIGIYPEWWKLAPMSRESWKQVDDLVARRDPWCRGVLVLGLNAPIKDLAAGFRQAALSATSRGFAVGRTIWHEPSRDWLAGRIGDAELISRVRASFEMLIREWRSARAARKERKEATA
jgi:5-dehydro-2-deoxygluconokinase